MMAFVCDVCGARFEAEDTINNRPELNALWIAAKELGWRTRQRRRGKWHTPGVRDRRLETVKLVARLQFRQTIPILPLSSRGG
jgi:frataxin-like iron-binding protein CyaY